MNLHNIIVMVAFVVGIVFFSHGSFAQSGVPVIEAAETNQVVHTPSTSGTSNNATGGRYSTTDSTASYQQISQQVQNIANMNLPQQISELQQKIQALQGQLQVQQHNLQLLNIQQRSFYEDLNQRINQISALSSSASPSDYSAKTAQNIKNQVTQPLSTSTNANANETTMYQNAFQLIMQKQYSNAQRALNRYLTQYPKGIYADSAHYWLGEIYLLQDRLSPAIKEFKTVINQYKTSNKISDAKLKLASIHLQQGNVALARREMQQIKQNYPNSTAAQLATIQLQQLNTKNVTTTSSSTSS
jgi:tol-pal system protein YbgF